MDLEVTSHSAELQNWKLTILCNLVSLSKKWSQIAILYHCLFVRPFYFSKSLLFQIIYEITLFGHFVLTHIKTNVYSSMGVIVVGNRIDDLSYIYEITLFGHFKLTPIKTNVYSSIGVIVVGNRIDDLNSNPEWGCLYLLFNALWNTWIPPKKMDFPFPSMGK